VHIDGTARPQIVRKKTNKKFYNLIKEFEKITGHAILINTSFNIQGEPIVNTPPEAIRCFFGTGIDYLAIGNYLIAK
jgi:carbamoyltransferase